MKTTVNFDDPGTYHLYYGDSAGKPGSLMTFFPWPDAPSGRHGTGQATTTSFSIPESSIGWWKQHLAAQKIETGEIRNADDEDTLTFREPGGTLLEVATDEPGFAIDEPLLELGRALKLPPWLEPRRDEIQHMLPKLNLPAENNPELS